jgi:hypothetical protein
MNSQFLKNHLIDFEVVAALCIGSLMAMIGVRRR